MLLIVLARPENVLAQILPSVSPSPRSLPKRCLYVRMSGTVNASHQAPVITNDSRVHSIVSRPSSAGPPKMSARQTMNGIVEPT